MDDKFIPLSCFLVSIEYIFSCVSAKKRSSLKIYHSIRAQQKKLVKCKLTLGISCYSMNDCFGFLHPGNVLLLSQGGPKWQLQADVTPSFSIFQPQITLIGLDGCMQRFHPYVSSLNQLWVLLLFYSWPWHFFQNYGAFYHFLTLGNGKDVLAILWQSHGRYSTEKNHGLME